ncbi:hypothetical protein D3C84_1131050 [compost metagenome]
MHGGVAEWKGGQAGGDFHMGFDPAGGGLADHAGDQGKQAFVGRHGTIPGWRKVSLSKQPDCVGANEKNRWVHSVFS